DCVVGVRHEVWTSITTALIILRLERFDGREFLLHYVVNRNDDIGRERIGLLELVITEEKNRVFSEIWRVRAEVRYRNHLSRVRHQGAHTTVIRMVVVGPVADDNISLPFTNETADRSTVLQGGHEFTVVNIQHVGLISQDFRALLHFGCPTPSQ